MKFRLNESKSPALDYLIDEVGLTLEQAKMTLEYFGKRMSIPLDLADVSTPEVKVEGITLLSTDEAEKVPEDILRHEDWWWLRSPGSYSSRAAGVFYGGSVYYDGYLVHFDDLVVRPALMIPNLKSLNLHIRDVVKIFDKEWFVISDDMVLLDGDLGRYRFNAKSNNYETSEIKTYIENWLRKQISKYGDRVESSLTEGLFGGKKFDAHAYDGRTMTFIYSPMYKKIHLTDNVLKADSGKPAYIYGPKKIGKDFRSTEWNVEINGMNNYVSGAELR